MRPLASLALTVLLANVSAAADQEAHNRLTEQQIQNGWISLFDGETLFGWQPTSDVDWRVDEALELLGRVVVDDQLGVTGVDRPQLDVVATHGDQLVQ